MNSYATHIVGGEIYYTQIDGSTRYRITVNVYFDCNSSDARNSTKSDEDIYISMWNASTNAYIDKFKMSWASNAGTILDKTSYNCIKKPSGVCVVAHTYSQIVTINPGTSGVILAWERCCRNGTIDNINNPGKTGFTAWTKIPPSTINNSSPYFNDLPPTYACVNAPLQFLQDATDPDGDSLVYVLSTPYLGATSDDPRPNNSIDFSSPPFNQIRWTGIFNESNQLAGSPQLNYNRTTGEMTTTPTETGQFVVGYTIKEYRNGVLIGETRRDYQINIIQCVFDVIADYTVPNGTAVGGAYTFECGDTVCFNNKSYSKEPATYFWDFGVENIGTDTSSETNPCYIFPSNGNYKVSLTATSSICEDIYEFDVRIRSSKNFELGPDRLFCKEFSYLLNSNSADAVSTTWNTGQSSSIIRVDKAGTYSVDVSYGKCNYADTVTIRTDFVPPINIPADSLFCDSVDVEITVEPENLRYFWSTGPTDTFRSQRFTEPGTYTVRVSTKECSETASIRLWEASKPSIADVFFCDDVNYNVDAGDLEEVRYTWSNGSNNQQTLYTQFGTEWLRVDQRDCHHIDTFNIQTSEYAVNLGPDEHFCDKLSKQLDAGTGGQTYLWNNGETSPIINANTEGVYKVVVVDSNGCEFSDSISLTLSLSPTLDLGGDTTICVNDPTVYSAPDGFSYLWSDGSTEQSIVVQNEGVYFVKITDQYRCNGTDSFEVFVDSKKLPNKLYVPNAFSPNGDGLNELFPYKEPISQPGYVVTIYSRWGEKVFDSREGVSNWNGYYKGELVNAGTFIYYMFYRGCDGNFKNSKGTVHAIR